MRRAIVSVRNALLSFVPNHLGLGHVSRDDMIAQHTRPMAKEQFASGMDVAILVVGGTFLCTCRRVAATVSYEDRFGSKKRLCCMAMQLYLYLVYQ